MNQQNMPAGELSEVYIKDVAEHLLSAGAHECVFGVIEFSRAVIKADRALRQSNQFAHLAATPEDMAIFDKIANTVLHASPAVGDVAMPELPLHDVEEWSESGITLRGKGWSEDLVKAYAQAALAAKDAEIARLKSELARPESLDVGLMRAEIAALTAERDALRKPKTARMTEAEIEEMIGSIGIYEGDYETAIVRATEKHHGVGL